MDLQALKTQISEGQFPEAIKAKLDEIVDGAIASGSLSEEDRLKLVELVELAVDMDQLEADTKEEMALKMTKLADELTRIGQQEEMEQKAVEKVATDQVDDLEKELEGLQGGQPVSQPTEETIAAPADQPMAGS